MIFNHETYIAYYIFSIYEYRVSKVTVTANEKHSELLKIRAKSCANALSKNLKLFFSYAPRFTCFLGTLLKYKKWLTSLPLTETSLNRRKERGAQNERVREWEREEDGKLPATQKKRRAENVFAEFFAFKVCAKWKERLCSDACWHLAKFCFCSATFALRILLHILWRPRQMTAMRSYAKWKYNKPINNNIKVINDSRRHMFHGNVQNGRKLLADVKHEKNVFDPVHSIKTCKLWKITFESLISCSHKI